MDVFEEWTDTQVKMFYAPVRNLGISGGLGAAKTAFAGRYSLAEMILTPGSRGAIGAPTYDQLFGSIFLELEERLRACGIRYRYQAWAKKLTISNGSSVRFVSFQVPSETLKGYEYDWGVMDEADAIEPEHHQLFSDRIGRNIRRGGTGKLRVFGNPVPYGHWLYQEFRHRGLPDHDLWEIPTYANRRFLTRGYIEKLERRYPPGSIGRKRWLLGHCGIPDELALFGEFDSSKEVVTETELKAMGGIARYADAMYFSDGHPVGYLLCGITPGGTVVAMTEVYHDKRSPEATTKAINFIRKGLRTGKIIGDGRHELYDEFRKHVPLRPARVSDSAGIARLRKLIALGQFKLLLDEKGEPRTPQLRNELEMHKASEITGKPEPQHQSLVWPAEMIAGHEFNRIDAATLRSFGVDDLFHVNPDVGLRTGPSGI